MPFRRTIIIEIEAPTREALVVAARKVAESITPDVDTPSGDVSGKGREYKYHLSWATTDKFVGRLRDPDDGRRDK